MLTIKKVDNLDVPEVIKDLRDIRFRRHRRIWRHVFRKYDFQYICEVGVFQGQNFCRMIEHSPKLAVAVDAWIDDGVVARNDAAFPQTRLDAQYEAVKLLADKYSFIKVVRQYSDEAAKNFADDYFDFVYIDADHSYEGCKKDLEAWYPKVKPGKIFAGDDYSHYHAPVTGVKFEVIKAVNEFAEKNNLIVYELPAHGWLVIKPL